MKIADQLAQILPPSSLTSDSPVPSMVLDVGSTLFLPYISVSYIAARSPGTTWRHLQFQSAQRDLGSLQIHWRPKLCWGMAFSDKNLRWRERERCSNCLLHFLGLKWLFQHFLKLFSSGLLFLSQMPWTENAASPASHSALWSAQSPKNVAVSRIHRCKSGAPGS